jgi:hypothetical protein
MPAGLGGGGAVFVALETVMGTYVDPTAGAATGVWVPIISEELNYTETKYYSPQIRQQTIVSDVQQSYYHVEGNITMEVDVNYLPYFLYASRHLITKSGTAPALNYKFGPGSQGSASGAASGPNARTMSICVERNGVGFGYAGCVVNNWEFTVDNGVLRCTMGILGTSETDLSGLGTPTWLQPSLFGAAAHSIYLDASGTAPAFADPFAVNFNGFTFHSDFNGSAQNRIQPQRSASYIAFGETNSTYDTELDFIDKADYNNMKNNVTRAIRFESLKGGSTFAAATEAFRITIRRTSFESYVVGLAGMGDLIMARVTGRNIGLVGADAYTLECKSPLDIT